MSEMWNFESVQYLIDRQCTDFLNIQFLNKRIKKYNGVNYVLTSSLCDLHNHMRVKLWPIALTGTLNQYNRVYMQRFFTSFRFLEVSFRTALQLLLQFFILCLPTRDILLCLNFSLPIMSWCYNVLYIKNSYITAVRQLKQSKVDYMDMKH